VPEPAMVVVLAAEGAQQRRAPVRRGVGPDLRVQPRNIADEDRRGPLFGCAGCAGCYRRVISRDGKTGCASLRRLIFSMGDDG